MLPFLFGVFVSFGVLVAAPHMSKEEEAIVFAMKGMSEAGFVHKTKKGKKPTLKDYGNAVKDYRVAKTGTGKRPRDRPAAVQKGGLSGCLSLHCPLSVRCYLITD